MTIQYALGAFSFPVRIAIFASSGAFGVSAQFLIPDLFGFVIGACLMLPGLAIMGAKNYRNKPLDLGFEDW
jgi:hypothetical protein